MAGQQVDGSRPALLGVVAQQDVRGCMHRKRVSAQRALREMRATESPACTGNDSRSRLTNMYVVLAGQ